MKRIIDAGSARLAGLQIDLLQKMRQGHITLGHLEWFTGLSKDARNTLMSGEKLLMTQAPPSEITDKFSLLADLGVLTVPADHVPATCLTSFRARHWDGKKKSFVYYSDDITDQNFPNPSRVLNPGDRFHVCVWKQIVPGTTTSKERMDFCRKQPGNCFTGAQGLSQVFEKMRDKLPKGFWHASFDEADRLPVVDGFHRTPCVRVVSDGVFEFDLGDLVDVWIDRDAFVSFCDQPLVA